jgi:hypothetical protein
MSCKCFDRVADGLSEMIKQPQSIGSNSTANSPTKKKNILFLIERVEEGGSTVDQPFSKAVRAVESFSLESDLREEQLRRRSADSSTKQIIRELSCQERKKSLSKKERIKELFFRPGEVHFEEIPEKDENQENQKSSSGKLRDSNGALLRLESLNESRFGENILESSIGCQSQNHISLAENARRSKEKEPERHFGVNDDQKESFLHVSFEANHPSQSMFEGFESQKSLSCKSGSIMTPMFGLRICSQSSLSLKKDLQDEEVMEEF